MLRNLKLLPNKSIDLLSRSILIPLHPLLKRRYVLLKNYNAVIDALEKEKANISLKGDLVRQAYITSSMGVSYKLKLGKVL